MCTYILGSGLKDIVAAFVVRRGYVASCMVGESHLSFLDIIIIGDRQGKCFRERLVQYIYASVCTMYHWYIL